jgi:hypothetical protein
LSKGPSVSAYYFDKQGNIFDASGVRVFTSIELFTNLVSRDDICFLCHETSIDKEFNQEHVIPNWVQNLCGLSDKYIKLPNETKFPYKNYKISCCKECNSFLGDCYESPISRAVSKGGDNLSNFLVDGGLWKIFLWMNLIYFKVHLKDNSLRLNRDKRAPDTTIGSLHDWGAMHHCHSLIRAEKFGIPIQTGALGSTMCLHLGDWAEEFPFDYNDHIHTHTIFIRCRRIAVICVQNDACGTLQGLEPIIGNLPPNLSQIQLSELITEFQFVSHSLKNRPKFMTSLTKGSPHIEAIVPEEFDLNDLDFKIRGFLMLRNLKAISPNFRLNGMTPDESEAAILKGDVSFIRELR